MTIKNFIKNIVLAAALTLPVSSCSDWLEVDMEDGIMEDALFADNEGYLIALNGVYSNLNSSYATFLGMGAIDVMAQYYNVQRNQEHPYYAYASYKYNDSTFDNASGALWSKLYSLILNLNVLLEHCDEKGSALSERYYNIVKGEALALRAMMHFDMLRLYGPIYSEETASQASIVYLKDTERKMQALLPAKDVVGLIKEDLTEAAKLLKDDPIRTEGIRASDSENINENNDFRYRQYRLNYYAIQGLFARLYMWIGDKTSAYNTVVSLLDENTQNEIFLWTGKDLAATDRTCSSEVFFGLFNTSRENLYKSIFDSSLEGKALSFTGGVAGDNSKLSSFYGDTNIGDCRRNMWESVEDEASFFLKYKDSTSESNHFDYMIPLMRLSEMYLILAETTGDLTEALQCINLIRKARNAPDITLGEGVELTPELIQEYITEEFAREVIGEGQLFFYYKRHAMTQIASGTAAGATFNMDLSSYVVPLPTAETNNRQ